MRIVVGGLFPSSIQQAGSECHVQTPESFSVLWLPHGLWASKREHAARVPVLLRVLGSKDTSRHSSSEQNPMALLGWSPGEGIPILFLQYENSPGSVWPQKSAWVEAGNRVKETYVVSPFPLWRPLWWEDRLASCSFL